MNEDFDVSGVFCFNCQSYDFEVCVDFYGFTFYRCRGCGLTYRTPENLVWYE